MRIRRRAWLPALLFPALGATSSAAPSLFAYPANPLYAPAAALESGGDHCWADGHGATIWSSSHGPTPIRSPCEMSLMPMTHAGLA